jgi:DNA mismatch repair protein MutL
VLDIETSNKISAGEVVEKPASVVKELIENSIDSQSKNIVVEILEGGQRSIKVIDDGYGIHPEDIEKAFTPHATSKIDSIEDIFKITTMGFRGEALASIAAVSNTTLKSRTLEYSYGKEVSVSGGVLNNIQDIACNVGTTIEVKDLFFNVPARLKFLKSFSREATNISDILNRLSLANPDIAFKLFNNNKKVLNTYGTGKLIDSIRAVYGKLICDNITSFEKHTDIASVHGYIGNSEISRGSRNNQTIFVNKRYIKSKLITAAVENAFKSFLTVNKYPFFIVFIEIFPEFVDVNVHPTKSEIKFKDDREIFKLTFDAVHEALRNRLKESFNIPFEDVDVNDNLNTSQNKILMEEIKNDSKLVQLPIDLKSFEENNYKSTNYGNNSSYDCNFYDNHKVAADGLDKSISKKNDFINHMQNSINNENLTKNEEKYYEKKESYSYDQKENTRLTEDKTPKFSSMNIIGQFHNTYVLAEALGELYIIDQHAAHEKILFEKYKKSIMAESVISQILITPLVIELIAEDYSYYIENKDIFRKVGFNIDIFGDNTISIREVPLILGKPDLKNLFIDILDNLKNMGSGETWEIKYNKIAKLACKSAVKANDILSHIEMKTLIEDLRFIDDPFTCPHGRPTIIKITLNELEKRFKRIQ